VRYLMAAIAILTCPCHLPILLAVLSGTALGALVSEHQGLAAISLTVLFLASAWGAVHLFSRDGRGRSARADRR
jgi:mercuric ion transport protein